jgi:glycosyltransferase involved in cell wall biosynthesis
MRIGMILDSDFPPDSRVENEAISLINAGHDVYLFSLSYKSFEKQKENINGIEVRRYKANSLIYKLSAIAYPFPFYHWLLVTNLRDFILENKIEALHVHDMLIARAVFMVNKTFRLPLLLDLHENRPEIMKFYPHLNKIPGRYIIKPIIWEKWQMQLVKQADKVVLVTREAKQAYIRQYGLEPDKIVVVPNTVHLDIFTKYPIKDELIQKFRGSFNLLYVGDTGLRRGTAEAIRAVSLLKHDIPEIKLILVGKSSQDAVLKKLVSELQLQEYVAFEGWQDVSLFPSYIKAADICLSPISRNLHHDTTYPNKIFQYMAMGKALIVSNSTAQANVVEQESCGLVYPADDMEALATAVQKLFSNPEQREKMGEKGFQAVRERWNWKITSRELINLYEQMDKS